MPNLIEFDRQFLFDTGGWKEMKKARSLHAAGKVTDVSYQNGILEGTVKDGKNLKVRLEIRSRTDIENHCPCFLARRDGIICCHALAVGLEYLEPTTISPSPSEGETTSGEAPPSKSPALSPDWPSLTETDTEAAIAASLHLVIAPNLVSAWDKNRISVGVEVSLGGERKLLSAIPASTTLFLDAADAALYRVLQQQSPETVPGMALFSASDFSRLLSAIPGHPRVTLGKKEALRISHLPWRVKMKLGQGLRFRPDWPADITPLISEHGTWALTAGDLLQPIAPGLPARLQGALIAGTTLESSTFLEDFTLLQQHFDLVDVEWSRPAIQVQLELEGSVNHLDAHLAFIYDEVTVPAAEDRPQVLQQRKTLQLLDTHSEREAIQELETVGFQRRGSEGRFVLKDKDAILQFLAHGYPAFQARWQTSTGERFEHALDQVEPITTAFDFKTGGEDWFVMDVSFGASSKDAIPRQEIERLLRMGQSGISLPHGKTAVLNRSLAESLEDILTDCAPTQLQPGTYRIDQSQADYLRETADDCSLITRGAVPWQTTEESVEFYDLSESLEGFLRPYQREGIQWMQHLASRGMGGILADDMGLGKTLQTLSFIYSVGGQSLVICPSSLIHNWVSEAAKFVPELKAVAIEGSDREAVWEEHGDADIIVTSYALLRRDEARYRDRSFDVVILDEAQHIKNPESQVAKAAHHLHGTYRFALTGTPIENSVRDLWSIAQFALPSYLGSRSEFQQRFEKPLASQPAPSSVIDRLRRRLRPVVLRRLKQEVAADLPERIEQVVYCDLKPNQRSVYEQVLQESRESILDAEGGRQRMLALTALLRLRQTCCDLRLLGLADISDEEASVKAQVLAELLDEAITGGHRVLVFSQFVEMLQLLVPLLAEQQVDFCYLDGKTRNRREVVERFQENEIPVFLISLKAGGVGLNLTAADTVIHVDPWWNPAVTDQATDRAHRIGQSRVVTSYRLITRATVEEKILALQDRKRAMSSSLLLEGGASGSGGLNDSELMSLFE